MKLSVMSVVMMMVIAGAVWAADAPPAEKPADARLNSARSTLQTVRAQMELYRIQHKDKPPTMASMKNWGALTSKTNEEGNMGGGPFGPYLAQLPMNPLNGMRNIAPHGAANANDGWTYDDTTGAIRLVMTPELAEAAQGDGMGEDSIEVVQPATAPNQKAKP